MNQTTNSTASQRAILRSASVAQTQRLGELLGALLTPGDVVLLHGDLGAGKTAFTQGIAAGLGVPGTVNSPTFTILKEYFGRLPLYHFDLYRIESPNEVTTLGFEDYFDSDGVSVIEWAERGEVAGRAGDAETLGDIQDVVAANHSANAPDSDAANSAAPDAESPWPADWLRVTLRPIPGERDGRALRLTAQGSRGQELLAAFVQAASAAQMNTPTVGPGGADAAGD